MPELPEVETTLSGIAPHLTNKTITQVVIRQPKLRWPILANLAEILTGQRIHAMMRRAKYILFSCDSGTLIMHLGMSGRVRLLTSNTPPGKHDHLDLSVDGYLLRYTDPRRFGSFLWTEEPPDQHPLLMHIGPEPLSDELNGEYLWKQSRKRKIPVKAFIMNSHVVAGVGNIYANEALYLANIRPTRAAYRITRQQYDKLSITIKTVLKQAIAKGGTTLKDFLSSAGLPGYFQTVLNVYGREGELCFQCKTKLKSVFITKRASVYCPRCQK